MDDLQTLIERRRWTQTEAAAALGVTRGAVARWLAEGEHARQMPGPARRLCRVYLRQPDLDPAELDDPAAT